jgi:hypothetical protein
VRAVRSRAALTFCNKDRLGGNRRERKVNSAFVGRLAGSMQSPQPPSLAATVTAARYTEKTEKNLQRLRLANQPIWNRFSLAAARAQCRSSPGCYFTPSLSCSGGAAGLPDSNERVRTPQSPPCPLQSLLAL